MLKIAYISYVAVLVLLGCQANFSGERNDESDSELWTIQLEKARALFQNGEGQKTKFLVFQMLPELKESNDSISIARALDLMAMIHYGEGSIDSSIHYWRLESEILPKKGHEGVRASLLSNVGITYLGKGFSQTAISYFTEAKKIFEVIDPNSENYWINHLNIGVSYMVVGNYEDAKRYFDMIPKDFSADLKFLLNLNYAKWNALQNNEREFYSFIEFAESDARDASRVYDQIFREVKMEYTLKFDNHSRINAALTEYLTLFDESSPEFRLMLLRGILKTKGAAAVPFHQIEQIEEQVDSADWGFKRQVAHMKSEYYKFLGDPILSCLFAEKELEYAESYFLENKKNDILDFEELASIRELHDKLEDQIYQNQIQQQKVTSHSYLTAALIMLIIAVVSGGMFLLTYFRIKQKMNKKELKVKNLELEIVKREQIALEESLELKSRKLQSTIQSASKIAILKNHIDEFFKTLETENAVKTEYKSMVKQTKMDFLSFFNNYQELAVMANTDGKDDDKLMKLKSEFPELNDNEFRVLTLVLQNYTSKEISSLLSCSAKNVEYYRTQIRKKLALPKEVSLTDFARNGNFLL